MEIKYQEAVWTNTVHNQKWEQKDLFSKASITRLERDTLPYLLRYGFNPHYQLEYGRNYFPSLEQAIEFLEMKRTKYLPELK